MRSQFDTLRIIENRIRTNLLSNIKAKVTEFVGIKVADRNLRNSVTV